MTKLARDELADILEELREYKGRATELISVYIPAGYNPNSVQKQLEAEKSTSKNIKSTSTRKNVTEALEKIVRFLKDFKKTPENGLAIFCGNVSRVEGQDDLQLWSVEPVLPLKIRLYRCDKEFVLEPLEEQLEVDEIFALLVMDRKEATIGFLEGKRIEVIQHMTSGIPSKVRAGGQCLSPDTLIMKDDGDIIQVKDSHNPLIVVSENFNLEETEKTPILAKWENNKELFKIITVYPIFEIKASKDHTFFVRTKKGIEEKALSEIKEGDYLVVPEKIEIENTDQSIDFVPEIKCKSNMKKVKIPERINSSFARLLGYYLGDGSYEKDRITFFEQREEVAKYYQDLVREVFGIDSDLRFREAKNYWQLRIYSRIISQLFKQIFPDKNKTLSGKVSSLILKSSNNSLSSFIAGFFDAEGYVSSRVAFGINNKTLTQQLQFSLLRLGIISSISQYDNNKNPYSDNIRYTLEINDLESLRKFENLIGFCSQEKIEKVRNLIDGRSSRNKVRQLVVNGFEVARIIRNSGLNTRDFHCGYFFCNKRQISKEVFKKKILDKIKNKDLRKRLELFYNSNLIAVKISKIESVGLGKTIDIETNTHNFIANGFVVHNSAQRFHRITEGLTKDFYKRISNEMKNAFSENKRLKGILVGGPIPTKDEFLDNEYLPTPLQKKVIGRIDIGDTDESGLKELVEKSQDILASQEIIHEKQLLERFFNILGKNPDLAFYKEEDVRRALKYGAVDVLLLSRELGKPLSKELKKIAEDIGSNVEIVSTETEEGTQFKNLSGIGAILRYKV